MRARYKKNERGVYATKVWDGTYDEYGRKHRVTISSKQSSADLEKKVDEFKKKLEEGNALNFANMTFYEYAVQWLELAKGSKEKNTQAMYRNVINKHLAFLDEVPITAIRHSHYQLAINNNKDKPRTCKIIKLTFEQVIKSAIKDKILPRSAFEDICEGISLPSYKKPEKRPLTPLELEAVTKVELDDRKACFLALLYYCGLRRGEALALTSDDFDWNSNTVSITKAVIFVGTAGEIKSYPKTDNGVRKVPFSEQAVSKIKPWVDKCPDKYLFHSANSEVMSQSGYRRLWDSIVTQLNVAIGYNPQSKGEKYTPPQIDTLTAHIFRHNYCTNLCYKIPQVSTKMIARLMGDTEKVVLDVYNHIIEDKEEVMETISDALDF